MVVAQISNTLTITPSLIFVGVQVNQATKAARASASQAHATIYQALTDDKRVRFYASPAACFAPSSPVAFSGGTSGRTRALAAIVRQAGIRRVSEVEV